MSDSARPGSSLLRRSRYVPLAILAAFSLAAACVGAAAELRAEDASDDMDGAQTTAAPAASGLPDLCSPELEAPAAQPWAGDQLAVSEAIWQSHEAEMREAYIRGEDGWIFWGDIQAANFSQAVGRRVLTDEEVDRWYTYLSGLRDELAAEGIPFYVAVSPAKWDIYPQYLPGWAQDLRGSVSLDRLLERHPDLPLIDSRASLREASVEAPTFSRVNSHWTDYGAQVAWAQIADCISSTAPQLGDVHGPESIGWRLEGDFNEYQQYGVRNPSPDWTVPEYREPLLRTSVTTSDGETTLREGSERTGLDDLPSSTTTEGATSTATTLLLRDSFGSSLSIPVQQAFASTTQVRHNFDLGPDAIPDVASLVDQSQPDVVILQMAERHLAFPPAAPG